MKNSKSPKVSIIIRTLNEEKFLSECLESIKLQNYDAEVEIIIVDSGSTDRTIEIGVFHGCKIVQIYKNEFTFGRSLNLGCKNSSGDILILLSAHCIPTTENWLRDLVYPITHNQCEYVYGRQIHRSGVSKFSEGMVFQKYYPPCCAVPQAGYFCNNANSAISRKTWQKFQFNEELTGLEDMELAKRLTNSGGLIGYVGSSVVEHIHEESWKRIKIRYEREAVALAEIEPNLNLTLLQASKMLLVGVFYDVRNTDIFTVFRIIEILKYRSCQFWGSYVGSKASKKRISRMKKEYFYPKIDQEVLMIGEHNEYHRITPDESK